MEDNGDDDDDDVASMDAPTLMAGQAREVCLAFEKARSALPTSRSCTVYCRTAAQLLREAPMPTGLSAKPACTPRRVQQQKERQLLTQASLQPRNFLSEVHDWKQYYTSDWTPDRGSSAHELERRRLHRPALVQTGR